MSNRTIGNLLRACAIVIDVTVPLAATLCQFPIWVDRSAAATMSGLFLIFAFLSCLPFIKHIKACFRSPSVWLVWVLPLVLLVLLRNIIDEMIIVCFFGAAANIIGAIIYKAGVRIANKPEKERGVDGGQDTNSKK